MAGTGKGRGTGELLKFCEGMERTVTPVVTIAVDERHVDTAVQDRLQRAETAPHGITGSSEERLDCTRRGECEVQGNSKVFLDPRLVQECVLKSRRVCRDVRNRHIENIALHPSSMGGI